MNQSNYKAYWVLHTVVSRKAAWWEQPKVAVSQCVSTCESIMTRCVIPKVKRATRYILHTVKSRKKEMFFTALPISKPRKYVGRCTMRGDAEGWSREINYTRLIRKEGCSDCIKSTSPNITQTLSTPAKLLQSGSSCLKLSVTSSMEVGLAFFLNLWRRGR